MKTRHIIVVAGVAGLVSMAAVAGIYVARNLDGLPLCTDLRAPAQVNKAITDHPGFVKELNSLGATVSVGTRHDCGSTVNNWGYIQVTYPIGSRSAVIDLLSQVPDMDVAVGLTLKF